MTRRSVSPQARTDLQAVRARRTSTSASDPIELPRVLQIEDWRPLGAPMMLHRVVAEDGCIDRNRPGRHSICKRRDVAE